MAENVLLEMKQIDKRFLGVHALKRVDLKLCAGEVHALLGENGAGKSTLIKILGGIYACDEGEIYIEGSRVIIHNVHDAQINGVSIIHQELVLVPHMTVAENIFLGREIRNKLGMVDKALLNKKAQELLDSFELGIQANDLIRSLTTAQQQMVEIIKALSYNSKILVMDEPTSSLSDKEVAFLFNTIRKLKEKGVGIIYISHRMSELFEICDKVSVLRDGEYIGTKDIQGQDSRKLIDELIQMMVGRQLTNYYTRTINPSGETVLQVKGLKDETLLHDVDFELRKGEILGFAGLVGAGRSEVMKCIFGLSPYTAGEILIDGKKIDIKNPHDAMKQGIALVPESRKEEALFLVQNVRYNLTVNVLKAFMKGIRVNKRAENQIADNYIGQMAIRTPSKEQTVNNLSGGNQQKVVIGRWLATDPKILILDEPTRGVDVGAKAEIYAIMNTLAAKGVAIIMISSELPEIINMSDRVMVMCGGTMTGCLDRDEITQQKIMQLATKH